jgi:hypothetical protein
MRSLVISGLAVLTATAASAHPDHVGGPALDAVHYITDPFHITIGILSVAAVLSLVAVFRGQLKRSAISQRRH